MRLLKKIAKLFQNIEHLLVNYFEFLRKSRFGLSIIFLFSSEITILKKTSNSNYHNLIKFKDKKNYLDKIIVFFCLKFFINKKNSNLIRLRSFYILMMHGKSYEFFKDEILIFIFSQKISHWHSFFTYIFHTSVFYSEKGDSLNHAELLINGFKMLYKNIKLSSKISAQQKIQIFSQTYYGSFQVLNNLNMKDFYRYMRILLKIYIDNIHNIKPFKRLVNNKKNKRIKLGLTRFDFLGEIYTFHHLFKYLDFNLFDVVIIAFDKNGLEEFSTKYPNIKHLILSKENIEASVLKARKENFDIILNSTSLSGDFLSPVTKLLSSRIGNKQVQCFVDITTSGIKNIDFYIIGKFYGSNKVKSEFTEKVLTVGGVGWFLSRYKKININRSLVRNKFNLSNSDIVYISNAHINKLNFENINLWLEIIKKTPNSFLLLMPYRGAFDKIQFDKPFKIMLNKILRNKRINSNKVIIEDVNGSYQCMNNMIAGDIYLDSFPYSGPTCIVESLALNIPPISLKGNYYREQNAAGFLNEIDLNECIAETYDDYIDKAINMASNYEMRKYLQAKIAKNMKTASFHNAEYTAKEYSSLLESIAKM